MKGFKVLDKDNYSAEKKLRKNDNESSIKYKLGKWISPKRKMGPLSIFKRKKRALKFRNNYNCYGFRIYRCLYIESNKRYLYDGIKKTYKSNIIDDTVFADKVKLIKEIV